MCAHIRWKVHGALFVQTINDVAQGHNASFARISIVVIIIVKWLFECGAKKGWEKKNEEEEEEMFIVYMFVLRLDDVQRTEEERTKPRKRTEIVTMLRLFLSLPSPFSSSST